MNAGRSLDVLVATRVLGWAHAAVDGVECLTDADCVYHLRPDQWSIPAFSTDIAAAWQVVEWLREMGHGLVIKAYPANGNYIYTYTAHIPRIDATIPSPDAPLAICLAALKAVGVDV